MPEEPTPGGAAQHGTAAAVAWGCQCDACTAYAAAAPEPTTDADALQAFYDRGVADGIRSIHAGLQVAYDAATGPQAEGLALAVSIARRQLAEHAQEHP